MPAFAWCRWLIFPLLFGLSSIAAAQERDPEGAWALRAGGRVMAVLELRRDPATLASWSGALSIPDQFSISDSEVASEVSGPIVRRAILSATSRGDSIELSIEGRTAQAGPSTFTFRMVEADAAMLSLRDAPIAPFALHRVPAGTQVAADWDPARSYPLAGPPRRSNPEMTAIFEADQAARTNGPAIDWSFVSREDEARRARTRLLLDRGALASADDYYHAAFIFQHGNEPDDYLLAHTLALVATARGRPDATWIAAATLDRYLQSIGHKQIYGTQFRTPQDRPATQEPYNRTLVPDALRQAMGVPPQSEQERQRETFDARAGQP